MRSVSKDELSNILKNCVELETDLETELKELMAEMDEGERLALARARGLPLSIYEALGDDVSESVRNATIANKDSPFV